MRDLLFSKLMSGKIKIIFGCYKMKLLNTLKELFIFIFSSKLCLSFSSFYVFLLFYAINNKIHIFNIFNINIYLNYIIYILFGAVFSYLCLLSVKNKKNTDHQKSINHVKPIEFLYISVYLGLIIISLELPKFINNEFEVFIMMSILFLIWLKLEEVSFFNFYWLFFGYRFYEINTNNSSYILISKRKDVKNKDALKSLELKRINNFTFLEMEKQNE